MATPGELFSDEILSCLDQEDSENELDLLMLAASQQYESWNAPPTATTDNSARASTTRPAPTTTAAVPSRFAPPKTSEEIQKGRQNRIPTKTKEDTKYCYKLWESWREYRQSCSAQTIPCLQDMAPTELNHWLSRFVVEARKTDGTEYPPNTLHHIVAGLQRHLRFGGRMLDLFKDQKFAAFQASLDGEMKRLQAKGLGINRRQAEVITPEEEETLWRTGQLGDSNPQQLLDTMIYCCGLFFALRSGREHRQLRRSPPQIQLIEQAGERSYLKYQEDISKNHPGGLKGRKITPKVVYHHANLVNPERCFVRLLKKYTSLTPPDAPANAFYLKPAKTPTTTCWYSCQPLGHNPLGNTVARLCRSAGISGFKTNHSLRATSASRLYQSGVEEQQIMERTGHMSLEGVRSYKKTSDEQREALSDILNCPSTSGPAKIPRTEPTPRPGPITSTSVSSDTLQLSHAYFSGCTVNFYVGKKE